jgi:antitoxin YefM
MRRYNMQRILLDEDVKPLSEFRANVASFIDKIRRTKRPLVITQRGKSAAIMMDVTEYEALLEKLELLSDIQVAESQVKQGTGLSHDDAKNKVLGNLRK